MRWEGFEVGIVEMGDLDNERVNDHDGPYKSRLCCYLARVFFVQNNYPMPIC